VRLAVYDLAGRQVRVLAAGALPAGRYTFRWDGRNEAGSPVPSGMYLVRVDTDGFRATRRLTMIR
jgi:flagellar hook assembly protein FlgD